MESKEFHQDLGKHDSKRAHLKAEGRALIRKQIELQKELDIIEGRIKAQLSQ